MTSNTKRALLITGITGGLVLLIGGVAFAKGNAPPSTPPAPKPQAGKLDPNVALAVCKGSFKSMAGREGELPSEVFALLTPNGSTAGQTGYAFFKDRVFKWVKENLAGYYECDNVDVAKLRQYTGLSGIPFDPPNAHIMHGEKTQGGNYIRRSVNSQLSPRAA